jgi:hypothetical protein
LRAITPIYTEYQYKVVGDSSKDKSYGANVIRKYSKKKAIWTHFDMQGAMTKIPDIRIAVLKTFDHWQTERWIELKASGCCKRYQILSPLPTFDKSLSREVVKNMEAREKQSVDRLQGVVKWATSNHCLAGALKVYFGEPQGSPCLQCSYCQTGAVATIKRQVPRRPSASDLTNIYQLCGKDSNARMMARVAYGLGSPKITSLGHSKSPYFGSLVDCDFEELLEHFQNIMSAHND